MKRVKLRLGVICRFSHTKDGIKWIAVRSAEDAVEKTKKYVEDNVFENWQFLGGDIKVDGKIIAIIGEYGNITHPSEQGNDCYELLPDFGNNMSVEELQGAVDSLLSIPA